jgi:hypothetical protein
MADASGEGLTGGGGSGSVTGSADGTRPFPGVSSAWWIDRPDPRMTGGPVVSTVVYLFSKPIACDKLSVAKWDETNEPADTLALEIEIAWSGPTSPTPPPSIAYPTVSPGGSVVPPPGTAVIYYQVTPMQVPGPPSELAASGGTVTLLTLAPAVNVTGTFDATFAVGNSVNGSFDASYCPGSREP